MIVWLGSYPRSGVVALRFALHHCFGLPSYSLDRDFVDEMPGQGSQFGYISHGLPVDEFLARAEASDDIYLTKTFGSPSKGERAIYLMRDGRSAIWSHWTFLDLIRRQLSDSSQDALPSLEEVVVGRTRDGSWSQHVDDWTQPGPDMLLLTYEQMLTDDRATIQQAAQFLGREPIRPDYLSQMPYSPSGASPFRYEENEAGIAEILRRCPDLFEAAHGEMMRRMGYAPLL